MIAHRPQEVEIEITESLSLRENHPPPHTHTISENRKTTHKLEHASQIPTGVGQVRGELWLDMVSFVMAMKVISF